METETKGTQTDTNERHVGHIYAGHFWVFVYIWHELKAHEFRKEKQYSNYFAYIQNFSASPLAVITLSLLSAT